MTALKFHKAALLTNGRLPSPAEDILSNNFIRYKSRLKSIVIQLRRKIFAYNRVFQNCYLKDHAYNNGKMIRFS